MGQQGFISGWRLMARLVRYALRRRLAMTGVLTTMLLDVGLNALRPWPMKVLVDNVLNGKPLHGTAAHVFAALPGPVSRHALLWWVVATTAVIFLLAWALGLAATYASIRFGQRLVYDLAGDLFRHLQRLSLRFHSRTGVGSSLRRVTTDSGCVSTLMESALLPLVTSVFSVISMFVLMLALDARLTLLSLAVLPLIWIAVRRYSEPMQDRSYDQQVAEGQMYDTLEETLSGLHVVKAFGMEEARDARFHQDTNRILAATISMTWAQFRFKVLVGLATALGTAALVYVGAHDVMSGRITVGTILVFLAYLASLYGPIEAIAYSSTTVHEAAGSARRVLEVLDADPEVAERPDAR